MKSVAIWKLITESLDNDIAVMLLYVLESKGSSPGRQGFFMAVNATGEMEGSIGGGIMEHKFVESAKKRLRSKETTQQEIKRQIHDKSAATDQSGMICSGEQTILLHPVQKTDRAALRKIISSIEHNRNGTLILSPEGIDFNEKAPKKKFEYTFQSGTNWLYKEKIGYNYTLFIIGGGHCSLALSQLMQSLGFYIHLYDERKELKTMLANTAIQEKHFIESYADLGNQIPSGSSHYVVIMTFGYRTDDVALRALFDKDFAYLGVLGSKKKMQKLVDDYRKEGVPETVLQRIQAPMGLAINSQTPEEIAVSIAAEIIKVKNGLAANSL